MALIIAAIIGGIIGLLYGSGIDAGRRLYALLNFIIGAVGGVLGIWFFFVVLKLTSSSAAVNIALLVLWAIVGAIILMAIVDAINYAVYSSRMRRHEGREYRAERGEMRGRRGYAHEYDVEEEETRTVKKKRK